MSDNQMMFDEDEHQAGAFSNDGEMIAIGHDDAISLMSLDGEVVDDVSGTNWVLGLAFSAKRSAVLRASPAGT